MYQKATIAFGVNVPSKNINIFNQSWIGIKMVILDFPTISHMFDVESITDIVIFNKYYRFVVRFNFRGEICVYLKNIYFATFLNEGKTYLIQNDHAQRVNEPEQLFSYIEKRALPFIYAK